MNHHSQLGRILLGRSCPFAEHRAWLRAHQIRVGKTVLAPGVVEDQSWKGMYRVRLDNGKLSDMVNLTRANDLALTLYQRKTHPPGPNQTKKRAKPS